MRYALCASAATLVIAGNIHFAMAEEGSISVDSGDWITNPDWENRLPNGNLLKVTENWLKKQHKRLRVEDHVKLKFDAISANSDGYGQTHARFKVSLNGIPVEGKEVIVHISEKTRYVLSVQGFFEVESSVDAVPKINRGEAISSLARQKVGKNDLSRDPELVLYTRTGEIPRLAWKIDISQDSVNSEDATVFVDANTSEDFSHIPRKLDVRQRALYDAAGTDPGHLSNNTITLVRQEGGSEVTDGCVNEAYDNLGATYNYFLSTFGRDSWDNNGAPLIGIANVYFGYPNAYFQPASPSYIVFGGATSSTNCVTVTDAVAHEFTHGVLLSAANLAVDGQSAALHESISDAFGSAVEAYVNGGINEYTWTVGEGIYPGHSSALRSMARPADFGSPDHISEYIAPTVTSNGSINYHGHENAGIPSLAFFLASQGGTHPTSYTGISVAGVGHEAALKVWYHSILSYMLSGERFQDMRGHTIRSAVDIEADEYSHGKIKNYVIPVANAWASVGVGSAFQSSVYACKNPYLDQYKKQVIDIYIAYYGRSGDRPGVDYWAM